MDSIRYTLLSDGSSDRMLMPILTWLLHQQRPDWAVQAQWADVSRMPRRPRSLLERVEVSLDLFPAELLFVHRDAEREPRGHRVTEIREALREVDGARGFPPVVCVVPVRMSEAWLLFDEEAIRRAAGNPRGREPLALPRLRDVEGLPDPKARLHDLLRQASNLSGRRLRNASFAPQRVAELIGDYHPLRQLTAFSALEAELADALRLPDWA